MKVILAFIFSVILFNTSSAQNEAGDTITFSGYKWVAKDSHEHHTGPGHNYFSSKKENVFVDDKGNLHLKMTHKNGRWYCAEVRLTESLGYGTYNFYIQKNPAKLDKELVLGFFTYDYEDSAYEHREIDVEFSKWQKENDINNSQFSVQPADKKGNSLRYNTDLSKDTRQVFEWNKKQIDFTAYNLVMDNSICKQTKYAEWSYVSKKPIKKGNEKVIINMWLFKADFPSDFIDYELVVNKFEFIK